VFPSRVNRILFAIFVNQAARSASGRPQLPCGSRRFLVAVAALALAEAVAPVVVGFAEALSHDRHAQMPQRGRAQKDDIIMNETGVSQPHPMTDVAPLDIRLTRAALENRQETPEMGKEIKL